MELVSKYNVRHPSQGFPFPEAVVFKYNPFHSTQFGFSVAKTTKPKASMRLVFNFNSGQMEFKCSSGSTRQEGTIKLDIKGDTPVFYLAEKIYSTETLAEALMQSFLGKGSSMLNVIPTTPEAQERVVLEALDQQSEQERLHANSDPVINSEGLRSITPYGLANHLRTKFQTVLEILEHDKMVVLYPSNSGIGVQLAPQGKRRLLISEEEYQRKMGRPSGGIVNTFHAPVGQVAMTTGDHSPVHQHQTATDIKAVLPLIEMLLEEVKKHPELPEDTEVEVEQLRLEAKKSRPNLQWVGERLETVKKLLGSQRGGGRTDRYTDFAFHSHRFGSPCGSVKECSPGYKLALR